MLYHKPKPLTGLSATSNAMEVMLAANAFSMGITKLPGSSPFWKVKIEMAKENTTINATAMTFATKQDDHMTVEGGRRENAVNHQSGKSQEQ